MPSQEVSEFGDVMTSRIRSFDEKLGTNNYISHLNADQALEQLISAVNGLRYDLEPDQPFDGSRKVVRKTMAVDVACLAMILWKHL